MLAVGRRHGVGPEEDTVLVSLEELPRSARLAAQLPDARPQLHGHVGELVEGGGHEGQVLGVVAHVEGHEGRLGVAREHAVAGLHDRPVAGKVLPVERPVGVVSELVPALVRAVDGQEERLGVGDVDEDGQAVGRARLPHRVEAWIVHLHQGAFGDPLPQEEPEGLEDLEPPGPRPGRLLDRVRLDLRIARVQQLPVRGLGAGEEAARVGLVEGRDRPREPLPGAAGQIQHRADALPVHDREGVLRRGVEGDLLSRGDPFRGVGRPGEVGMDVDHGMARLLHARLRDLEHAPGPEVLEQELAVLGRAHRVVRRPGGARHSQAEHPESGVPQPLPAVEAVHVVTSFVHRPPGSAHSAWVAGHDLVDHGPPSVPPGARGRDHPRAASDGARGCDRGRGSARGASPRPLFAVGNRQRSQREPLHFCLTLSFHCDSFRLLVFIVNARP